MDKIRRILIFIMCHVFSILLGLSGHLLLIYSCYAQLISINGSIAFIFSVKICLAVKRNANNKFKCGRMGHGDEVLRFYKNCAI